MIRIICTCIYTGNKKKDTVNASICLVLNTGLSMLHLREVFYNNTGLSMLHLREVFYNNTRHVYVTLAWGVLQQYTACLCYTCMRCSTTIPACLCYTCVRCSTTIHGLSMLHLHEVFYNNTRPVYVTLAWGVLQQYSACLCYTCMRCSTTIHGMSMLHLREVVYTNQVNLITNLLYAIMCNNRVHLTSISGILESPL